MKYQRRWWIRWLGRTGILSLALLGTWLSIAVMFRRDHAAPRSWAWLASLTFMLAAAVSWWWQALRERQIRRLTDAANSLASGQTPRALDEGRRDEWGEFARAFNRMVTSTSQRERQTKELFERLATVLAAMVEGVLAVDANQRILFANPAAGHLLGFDAQAAEGKKLLEVTRNRTLLDALAEAVTASRRVTRESKRYEIDSPFAHGQILSLRANPLPGGSPAGALLVLQDVTELRRLEHLRQEFVANVSHELKTPLTAIKAYAETLQRGAVDDPQINRQFVAQIEDEAERLHELILDLLQLARIESGLAKQEIQPVSVHEVFRKCLARREAAAKARSVTVTWEEVTPAVKALADFEGLEQILDNLLDNAIKYTGEGGNVSVRWWSDGPSVQIDIVDTGIGIPRESLARVFERFYRVDRARSRELGSTGLGLAIVKHLVQSLGGTVSVVSEVGAGSTFTVRLPLAH